MSSPELCASCQATKASLQRCGRCKKVSYCNRDCQKAHYKTHKKTCFAPFQAGQQDQKPFTAISQNAFLHDRTEEKTFQILIDCLRMRQEDMYSIEQEHMDGSIYDEEPTSEGAFRIFIRKAAKVDGLLPPWWTSEKLDECVRYSLASADYSLAHAQEKHDIQKQWGDDKMPMKLRLIGERVWGNSPGGMSGNAILGMMMSQEKGTGPANTSTIDIAAMLRGGA